MQTAANGLNNCNCALPRRITMGMDDMFGWNANKTRVYRRSAEMTGATDGAFVTLTQGLMAGTRVASNLGWRAVEALAVGDLVLTFDHGLREITEIHRATVCLDAPDTAPAMWPVIVPVGALDNRVKMTLLADQGVLVESDAAAEIYGDPFAIVPAHTLQGVRGIHRAAPSAPLELIAIYFEDEQVVYAEGGALIHCRANTSVLDAIVAAGPVCYDVLSTADAAYIAKCMAAEETVLTRYQ